MKIVMFGAPGAGKGTVSDLLSDRYKIPHISTGDIFRKIRTEDSELGRKVKELINNGRFVPDDITIEIIKKRLEEEDCKNGYILDGFPRTINQAKALEKIAAIDVVINLNLDEEYIVKRLLARRNCPKCGRGYNLITSLAPKYDEICDVCKVKLVKREDDNEEIIRQRQETYKMQTKPLLEYYRKKGLVKDVDASGEPDEIVERIIKIL